MNPVNRYIGDFDSYSLSGGWNVFDGDTTISNASLPLKLERRDGKGYPDGLSGEDIHIYARILCLADSYDAMTTDRIYRPRLDFDAVVKEIETNSGTQFDPNLAHGSFVIGSRYSLNLYGIMRLSMIEIIAIKLYYSPIL